MAKERGAKMVKELKELMAKWNKLGDMYFKRSKSEHAVAHTGATVSRAKSDTRYKCAEELRALLLKLMGNID